MCQYSADDIALCEVALAGRVTVRFATPECGAQMALATCSLLRLRDVPWADYDLQGLRDHREKGRLVPYYLSVDGEL